MDDDSMCKICMDSPVAILLFLDEPFLILIMEQIDCVMLECGHMCTCTQCGKQMAECPICRQYVVRYFSRKRKRSRPDLMLFPRLQSCQDFQGLSWDCGRSVSSSQISYSRIFSDSFLSRSTFKPVPMSRLRNYSPNTRQKYILAYGHASNFSVLLVLPVSSKCLLCVSNQVSQILGQCKTDILGTHDSKV